MNDSLDIALLRDSFALVLEKNPDLTRRFYEIFFHRYPEVRPMFQSTVEGQRRQERMLAEALVGVLDQLGSPELARTLGILGARHVEYGVRDEMYGWVGECLLATLAEVAAEDWSPKVHESWSRAIEGIATMMLAGAAAARLESASNLKTAPPRNERRPVIA